MISKAPKYMKITLWLAAAYNLVWGALIAALPQQTATWLGLETLQYPQLWQCIGMIVGVYGIGYACAAPSPLRHWPIVLVGFLGKLFGPVGFLFSAMRGELPWRFGLLNVTNDLIWLAPFALILHASYRASANESRN